MRILLVLAVGAGLAIAPGTARGQDASGKWSIHEWGTFTALQKKDGSPLAWINTEDEPVPPFCHRLSRSLLVPVDDLAPTYQKDAPRAHPDVILRLETPVVYFHPPASAKLPVKADFRVDFRGELLRPKSDYVTTIRRSPPPSCIRAACQMAYRSRTSMASMTLA